MEDNEKKNQMSDSLNRYCELIVCNDSRVLIYGGGAFGNQFFPNKEKFFLKKHNRND